MISLTNDCTLILVTGMSLAYLQFCHYSIILVNKKTLLNLLNLGTKIVFITKTKLPIKPLQKGNGKNQLILLS